MAENESFIGRMAGMDSTGLAALKAELGGVKSAINSGLGMGVLELATGGSKVKAIWESIKWTALARAGLGGFTMLAGGAYALTGGIRKAVTESGILQAALSRLGQTKVLTTQFTAFLGSVDLAKRRVAELFALTANSKFNLNELAGASKAITIMSNGAEGGAGTLQMLGKIATSTGSDLQELALAYGKVSQQTRNREDISGSVNELQSLGVISEATAHQLIELQSSGASGASIMARFREEIANVAAVSGDTEESMATLQDRVEKLKAAAAAGFGKSWMAQEKKDLENQVNLYGALIPAAEKLGEMLEFISRPAVGMKNTFGEIAGTDWFKGTVSTLSQMAVVLPLVATGYAALKGVMAFAKTTKDIGMAGGVKGLWNTAKGAISPAAASKNLIGTAGRLGEMALEKTGTEKMVFQGLSKGAEAGSLAMGYLSKGLGLARVAGMRLLGMMSGLAAPTLLVSVAAYLGVKAWDMWRESVSRAAHAAELIKESFGVSSAMAAEIAGLKTLDDKTRLVTKARNELNEALKAQAAVRGNAGSTAAEESAAAALVTARRRAVGQAEGVDEKQLGFSAKVMEQKFAQLRVEKEIAGIVFAAEFERASSAKQTLMLMERQRDNAKILADYQKSAANQPMIEALDKTITQGHTERTIKAQGLGGEMGVLSERVATLTKERDRAKAGGLTDRANQLNSELSNTQARMGQIGTQIKHLRTPGLQEQAAIDARDKLQKGPGSAHFDQLQAAAAEARKQPGGKGEQLAQGLELEAAKWRIKSREDAEKDAKEAEEQLQTRKRQGSLRKNELNVNEKALKITSETYQAEDEFARAKMAGIERQRQLLVDAPKSNDPAVQQERDNQIRGFEQQQAELQKDIDERARSRAIETAAFESAIKAHKLNNEAILAAAKGNFAQADAALKAAQDTEDAQAKLDQAIELKAKGYSEPEIAKQVAESQAQRESDRGTKADSFRAEFARSQQEAQLQLGERGIGGGLQGGAAREERIKLEDQDRLRAETARQMEALGPGHAEEATKNALAKLSTDLQLQAPIPGQGQVADSLTRIGGGGGIYAGASADPQLATSKRIADLTNTTNVKLSEISELLKKGQGIK